jgi:putative transposase
MAVFEKFHFEHPYYGSRRLAVHFGMSRDKAQHLMRDLHLVATYPKPKTTTPNNEHKKFHYLLRNILPVYPNHIWSTDITYIAMSQGFMYLTAIIDWYSRMILSWRISMLIFVGSVCKRRLIVLASRSISTVIKVFNLLHRSI